ncbi:patatin-like phospholipase family protein [bacterium]|nr:patatin-like phospholipase family protein [bacterium]
MWPLKKRIGLALGGGAARGIAHLGVIKALEDNNIPIHCIAGTSSGSLVGGLYASGADIDTMIVSVSKIRWMDLAGFHLSFRGMMSSRKLERFVSRMVGNMKLKDLKIPFWALSTDILSGEGVAFTDPEMFLAKAIRASSSFPGVYSPVKIGDRYYVDGGASHNIPIAEVKQMGANVVIAVDVIPNVQLDKLPNNLATMTDRGLDLLLHRSAKASYKSANIVLNPINENINSFDLKKAERMIELGYQAVIDNLDQIKKITKGAKPLTTRPPYMETPQLAEPS